MSIDLNKKTTQAKFAQMVGVTQPAVSSLIARGIITPGDTAGNWLLGYCGHLREGAAGRTNTSDLDLTEERARLAAAQADKIEMELAVMRNELVSVSIVEQVLVAAAGKMAGILDAVPSILKRRLPDITEADVSIVRQEIAKARNTIAALSLEDIEQEGDPEEVS